ncbi:MAG: methyl-accepting chemotaxis protein [Pseudomonadota bacterium]
MEQMFKTLQSRVSALITIVSTALLLVFTAFSVYLAADREVVIAKARQASSLATAAQALAAEFDGVQVTYASDGAPERIEWTAPPDVSNHALIDRIGAMTGETATVFVFDQESRDFWRRSTNIVKPDGTRAVGTPLGVNGAVYPFMMRGETFAGEANILGQDYYTIYEPIRDQSGAVDGILYVGVSKAAISETIFDNTLSLSGLALSLIPVLSIVAYVAASRSLRDLSNVQGALDRLVRGEPVGAIPGVHRDDAIGDLARAVESFRADRAQLAEAEATQEQIRNEAAAEREEMLSRVQESFGEAANAAAAGDFATRVTTEFDETSLRELANTYNTSLRAVELSLAETNRALGLLASGDLNAQIAGDFEGSFQELQNNLNGSVRFLANVVGQISTTATSLQHSAGGIMTGAEDLASRAEQQASALQQTAATMEEMSASVKSNASTAESARNLASEATERAASGAKIVNSAVSAMGEIEKSATQIADIISVIDGIAFQTNLLALNAAVEAARAGDAGKGFAVVASEVRALAQRSSEASSDIRQLIQKSAAQVTQGVQLVTDTGASLDGLASSIAKVDDAIQNIAAASVEQASGVEQISDAVSHMDQMTQKNASLAEQSACEARTLNGETRKLQDLLAFFKGGDGAHRTDGAGTVSRSAGMEQEVPEAMLSNPRESHRPRAVGEFLDF